jgi:hypothetical protein
MLLLHVTCSVNQRYHYYVEQGIPDSHLAPMPEHCLSGIRKLIPDRLLSAQKLFGLAAKLEEEIIIDYKFSVCKSIGMSYYHKNGNLWLVLHATCMYNADQHKEQCQLKLYGVEYNYCNQWDVTFCCISSKWHPDRKYGWAKNTALLKPINFASCGTIILFAVWLYVGLLFVRLLDSTIGIQNNTSARSICLN